MRSRKGEWLLALLAIRARAVSRSWLAGTLWPDSSESRALLYLRRELMYLRQALRSERHRLVAEGSTLRLELENANCDLTSFDSAIASGDERLLELAVGLYAGPLLDGCHEEWVYPERIARERAYISALERLAASAIAISDSVRAISFLRRIIYTDRMRESAHRSLMTVLADSGDTAAAIRVFRDLQLHLHDELNLEPDPETTALYHRLRERVRGSEGDSGKSRTRRLDRIPAPFSALVGRRRELEEIGVLLGHTRLVTLTGAGGIGKTRLSIEAARNSQGSFADGVAFVEFAALKDPSLVPSAVLEVLGIKAESRQSPEETLADRLKNHQCLLVFDNCEHLLTQCASLAAFLLSRCSGLRILATSREALGIMGESVWRVPSLSIPPDREQSLPRPRRQFIEAEASEAVSLFVERSKLARSGFALTTNNAQTISHVVRRLDGIPLAIELAAARISSLAVEEIEDRLDRRFSLLTKGSRSALPRHQTLRSLIDWSCDLLNESEKALMARLSIFTGGWTLESAEVICSAGIIARSDVLELLTSLVEKSLVVAEYSADKSRYRYLESIREYAQEKLSDDVDRDEICLRHLQYYAGLAEQAESGLVDADQRQWLERIELEHGNIRSALHWAGERGEAETGLRLAAALWRFWIVRGHVDEGRLRLAECLEAAPELASTSRAKALYGAGNLAVQQGDISGAREFYEQALKTSIVIKDAHSVAMSHNGLGLIEGHVGNYDKARSHYLKSLYEFRHIGDRRGEALALNNLGDTYAKANDTGKAVELQSQALIIRREIRDSWGIANSLGNLGILALERGALAEGRDLLEDSLALRREIGDRGGTAWCLIDLGNLVAEQREFSHAQMLFLEALEIECDLGERPGIAEALEGIARIEAVSGSCLRSAQLWGAAERLREEIKFPLTPSQRIRYESAIAACRAAAESAQEFDRSWREGRAMELEEAIDAAMNTCLPLGP